MEFASARKRVARYMCLVLMTDKRASAETRTLKEGEQNKV